MLSASNLHYFLSMQKGYKLNYKSIISFSADIREYADSNTDYRKTLK